MTHSGMALSLVRVKFKGPAFFLGISFASSVARECNRSGVYGIGRNWSEMGLPRALTGHESVALAVEGRTHPSLVRYCTIVTSPDAAVVLAADEGQLVSVSAHGARRIV